MEVKMVEELLNRIQALEERVARFEEEATERINQAFHECHHLKEAIRQVALREWDGSGDEPAWLIRTASMNSYKRQMDEDAARHLDYDYHG